MYDHEEDPGLRQFGVFAFVSSTLLLMQIVRHNSVTEIRRAPAWWLNYLTRHLSVPLDPTGDLAAQRRRDMRFGAVWWHEGRPYGSLVKSDTVPAGLTPHVEALAEHYGLMADLTDAREQPFDGMPWWSVQGDWRPYQERVHKKLLRASTGVIDAPPRSGKTLMTARLIDMRACPCVVIAPSVQIVRQTYERMREFFGNDCVSRLDGNAKPHEKDPEKPVVITTPQTAVSMSKDWWDTREMLIIDEFHHAAAETYHKINVLASEVYYRFGFTGTHFRSGDDRLAMDALTSTVLEKIHLAELIPKYLAPPHVGFVQVRSPKVSALDWRSAYQQGIVDCAARNDLVVVLAKTMLENGIPTLVLTRRRKHADELAERIPDAISVKGGENTLTSAAVRDFVDGAHSCLVGTTVLGEGVDIPRAGALIFASGGQDGVPMAQGYFRPLTAFEGKRVGRIYDFVDEHHSTLSRHSNNRIGMARSLFGEGSVHVGR